MWIYIHFFNRYIVKAFYEAGPVLGTGYATVSKTNAHSSCNFVFQWVGLQGGLSPNTMQRSTHSYSQLSGVLSALGLG